MKVCAVTCTGGRPELFDLCKRWVGRQTVPVDHWVVVTDNGDVPDGLPSYASFQAVTPWRDVANTEDVVANYSLFQALQLVPPDHAAVVFEDDDWYSADHVARCLAGIDADHDVAFSKRWIRYHLPLRMVSEKNKDIAGEGRVLLRPDAVAKYAHHLMHRPLYNGNKPCIYSGFTSIGIKGVGFGLPGRAGATSLHRNMFKGMRDDQTYSCLKSLIGAEDANAYIQLLQ